MHADENNSLNMKKDPKIKNVLITGNPGVGKTTLIKELISKFPIKAGGFYTSEIRDQNDKRWGFKIISLDGREEVMASVDIKGEHKVSRYGVNINAIDEIGTRAITEAIETCQLIVIDEIGRMELLSRQFANAVLQALNSPKIVLGTISKKNTNFIKKIKEREDVKLVSLTRLNYSEIEVYLTRLISYLLEIKKH